MRYRRTKRLELQLLVLLALATRDTLDYGLKLLLIQVGRRIHRNAFFIFVHLVAVLSIHVLLLHHLLLVLILNDHFLSASLAIML